MFGTFSAYSAASAALRENPNVESRMILWRLEMGLLGRMGELGLLSHVFFSHRRGAAPVSLFRQPKTEAFVLCVSVLC